jgi:hypothetical protein
MKKAETLSSWKALPDNLPMLAHMNPIPYKARGSTYGACGIRIDGTPQFVESVLSHLKELIDGENHITRLALNRTKVDGSGIGKDLPNAAEQAEVCYIRLHVRGSEGAIASSIFDKHLNAPTERFASALQL